MFTINTIISLDRDENKWYNVNRTDVLITTLQEEDMSKMEVFTVLGMILDSKIENGGCVSDSYCDIEDEDVVYYEIDDSDIIRNYMLPLCSEEDQEDSADQKFNLAEIRIQKSATCRGQYELDSITFMNKKGEKFMFLISDRILQAVTQHCLDNMYFKICGELAFWAQK